MPPKVRMGIMIAAVAVCVVSCAVWDYCAERVRLVLLDVVTVCGALICFAAYYEIKEKAEELRKGLEELRDLLQRKRGRF